MAGLTGKKLLGMDQTELNLFTRRYGISFVMLIMIIGLAIASPTFRTSGNVLSILLQVSINGILAMGMVFVITAGGIDLSIGSMLALTSTIMGVILNETGNIVLACAVSIAATTFFGFINGILVAKFKLFPFVVTLATQLVIRGIAYLVSGGYSLSLSSTAFMQIGAGRLFGIIPYPVIILLCVIAVSYVILHNTKLGRYVYAVGGNINAATASGVNVFWTQTKTFIISGICCGIAGIIMTSRINAAQPNIGVGYETDAIAACVIGGTSFAGGVSTIPGTVVGIIIIGLIYNGMNLIGISSYWQTITKGLLIIGAVMVDMFMNKRR
ncbi:MAG: ABC transporter permease [Treponema sp.]|jgi:ribose/xylose/arabinose/galactoside ABC-type transport system permease subunit|nr:ABC transporter permease [Treponema sp.]